MGQYVQLGICNKAIISKTQLEGRVTYEEFIEEMNKELNLELYNIIDDEEKYIFVLKSKALDKDKLIEFLEEQYDLCYADKVYTQKIIDKMKNISNSEDVINLDKEKKYENFQYNDYAYGNIYCTKRQHKIVIEYELMVYFIQGKILMECYYDFLKYIAKGSYPCVNLPGTSLE